MSAERREFRRGAWEMAPLAIGYAPFGLLVGAAVSRTPDPLAGWSGTLTIYGGSAHLAVLDLLSRGAPAAVVIATGALVNARLLVYSMALAPLWAGTRWPWRLAAAAMVVDPVWMLAQRRAQQPGSLRARRAHFLGCGAALAGTWLLWVTLGASLGSASAGTMPLSVAVPLCLASMVVPHLRLPGGWAAVGAAVAVQVVTRSWPAGSGLLLAMVLAALAGLAASGDGRRP
jgi:predicted branched-subunit amino acid permease